MLDQLVLRHDEKQGAKDGTAERHTLNTAALFFLVLVNLVLFFVRCFSSLRNTIFRLGTATTHMFWLPQFEQDWFDSHFRSFVEAASYRSVGVIVP